MAEKEASKTVSFKLLVDGKNNVVLFAEAGKDFVDLLFHVLALPVGTVVKLIMKTGMVGSLGNLYQSIDDLDDTYCVQPSSDGHNAVKDSLLKPRTPSYLGTAASSSSSSQVPLLFAPDDSDDNAHLLDALYCCSAGNNANCCQYISVFSSATCPACKCKMNKKATFVDKPQSASGSGGISGGYVKGVVTYMVMDDLSVKPMSTISSITLLNKFNVTDLNLLEEKFIDFGMEEVVALLNASLQSKTVLTDVFLGGKKKKRDN